MIGIYKITSPTGRIYIGQSRCIEKRFNSYKNFGNKTKGQPKLHGSLVKYGYESHLFEVIEICLLDDLNIRERYWQDFYKANSKFNLNCSLTETTVKARVISDETRRKQSEASVIRMKRLLKDENYISLMRAAYDKRIGVKRPEKSIETRERNKAAMIKIGAFKGDKNPWHNKPRFGKDNPMYGRVQSDETKRKIAEKATGRLHNDEAKKKMSEKRSMGNNIHAKIVLNTETGIYYGCIKEAAQSVSHYTYSTVKSKINGRIKNNTQLKLA